MGFSIGGAISGAASWVGKTVEDGAEAVGSAASGVAEAAGDALKSGGEALEGAREWVGDRLDDVDRAKAWVGGRIDGAVQGAEHAVDGFRQDVVRFGEQHGGVVGKALAEDVSGAIGVTEGAGLALYDMGKGVVQLADGAGKLASPLEWAAHGDRNLQRLETVGKTAGAIGNLTNPAAWVTDTQANVGTAKALWNGVTAGYQDAAKNGDWSKFIGRGVVDVGSFFVGAGEANAALKGAEGAGAAARLAEGANAAEKVGEGANALGKAGDAGKAAEGAADGAKAAAKGAKATEAGTAAKAASNDDDLAAILKKADTGETVGGKKLLKFDSFDDLNTAANAAQPNTVYQYGKLSWTTDAEGRVARAEGDISLDAVGRNDPTLQRKIGNEGYDTDVGFHLIADSFGGPTNRLNVVPGNGKRLADGTKNLNTGAYSSFEREIRTLKEANPDLKIEIRVDALYDAGNTTSRPDHFVAAYKADGGSWIRYKFDNIH